MLLTAHIASLDDKHQKKGQPLQFLSLCPKLDGHHSLFRVEGREKVLLRQEIQGKLDQKASYLFQFSEGLWRVLCSHAWA